MQKIKKLPILLFGLLLLLTLSVGSCLAGCTDDNKKYDVAIRIGCSDGSVYEFPIGTDELRIEYMYDGSERTFGVQAYNLPDHPRWSEDWITPSVRGQTFSKHHLVK